MSGYWREAYQGPKNPFGQNYGVPREVFETEAVNALTYRFSPHIRFDKKALSVMSTEPHDLLNWGMLFARGVIAQILINEFGLHEGKMKQVTDLADERTLPTAKDGSHANITEALGFTHMLFDTTTLKIMPPKKHDGKRIIDEVYLATTKEEDGSIKCEVLYESYGTAINDIFTEIEQRITTNGQYLNS